MVNESGFEVLVDFVLGGRIGFDLLQGGSQFLDQLCFDFLPGLGLDVWMFGEYPKQPCILGDEQHLMIGCRISHSSTDLSHLRFGAVCFDLQVISYLRPVVDVERFVVEEMERFAEHGE